MYEFIKKQDAEIFAALEGEETREREGLELIPSENYVSKAVREAQGSILTNKYAEGYPGKRYYGGQQFTDMAESLAIERAKQLFGAKFANVQTHSGANANIATYMALLQPGEIDYDEMRRVAVETKPKIVLAGFSAYSRELDYEKFASIAKEVGAYSVMDAAHIAGLIAGSAAKNPFDYGFDIITSTTHKTLRGPRGGLILTRSSEEIAKKIDKAVFPGLQGGPLMHVIAGKAVAFGEALHPNFKLYAAQILKNAKAMEAVFRAAGVRMLGGGTSNHLILADVFGSLGITGQEAETVLDRVGITLNKNAIADDTRKPMDPSGIRFGTPAITTRWFKEGECARVAELMLETLKNRTDEKKLAAIREEIKQLAASFPIPDSFV